MCVKKIYRPTQICTRYEDDTWSKHKEKQVDILPSKNQAPCDLIYNVLYISNLLLMGKSRE